MSEDKEFHTTMSEDKELHTAADQNGSTENSQDSSLITMKDEHGKEVHFELLDIINYSGTDYAVMLPAEEDSEDADQVLIFRVDDGDKDVNTLTFVDNPETAQAIFELFKTKNAGKFDFE